MSFALAARVSSLRQREFETEKENENVFFLLYFFFDRAGRVSAQPVGQTRFLFL